MRINKHFPKTLSITIFITFMLGSCMVGPNFKPPSVELPDHYRFSETTTDSLINLEWWELFKDPTLQALIKQALAENKNLLSTLSKVEQAKLNQRNIKGGLFPKLNYTAEANYGNEALGVRESGTEEDYIITPTISWELDLWGKIRRNNRAALQNLLATEYGLRAVQLTLIAEVATTYFQLLDYQRRLEISEQTYQSADSVYQLVNAQLEYGYTSRIALNQSEIHRATAALAIPQYQRAVAQTQNSLSVLIGINPESIKTSEISLTEQSTPVIPVGIPSNLLDRRPDVAEAFHTLWSETEKIGATQALRYPSISLSGTGGTTSSEFDKLFTSNTLIWNAIAKITGPVFAFGINKRNVEIQRESAKQSLLSYENTLLEAIQETENALIGIQSYQGEIEANYDIVQASKSAFKLSYESYKLGAMDYLSVLSAQQTLFQSQLSYSESLQEHMNSYVALYKALGGGWIVDTEE